MLILLLVVVVVVVGLTTIVPFARERLRVGWIVSVPVLVLAALALAAAVPLVLVGVRDPRGDDPGPDRASPPASRSPTESTTPAPTPTPTAARLGPVVELANEADEGASSFPSSYPVVDELVPGTVLQVRVRAFEPFARGRAEQCRAAAPTSCGNAIDVQFDAAGTAAFQYLVSNDFSAGECRAHAAACSIVVRQLEGPGRAEVQTLFGDRVPPAGRIKVMPSAGLTDGQAVRVTVERFPPRAQMRAMLCAPPDAVGRQRCGAPGPTAPMTIGPDGTGTASLRIQAGPVGTQHWYCGQGSGCGVSVTSDTVFARAPVVPVTFRGPPGANYELARLGAGLGAAALLAAIAAWVIRRSDWSPVGEEVTPELDAATYADLDAIVAALPPDTDLDEQLAR